MEVSRVRASCMAFWRKGFWYWSGIFQLERNHNCLAAQILLVYKRVNEGPDRF
jgi:hypothetical protein